MDKARSLFLLPLYRCYERRLLRHVRWHPVPRHIGLILDGNRRFGQRWNLTNPQAIYMAGADKLDDLLEWCVVLGIPAVTLWVLSTENLKRESKEVSGNLAAIEAKLTALAIDPQIHHQRIRVQAVGRLDLLPTSTVAAVRAAEAATRRYEGITLTIAAAYGGREEITDAVKSLLRDQMRKGTDLNDAIEAVMPEAIGRHLYTPDLPDPDLIIRTSGEIRLSGSLLWQSAHSEFYFTDVFWPAFRQIDFLRAVRAFQQRRRSFGRQPAAPWLWASGIAAAGLRRAPLSLTCVAFEGRFPCRCYKRSSLLPSKA